jgi:opacity protein-like surface antigen
MRNKIFLKGGFFALALLGFAMNASAVGTGFYGGIMAGPAMNGAKDLTVYQLQPVSGTPSGQPAGQTNTQTANTTVAITAAKATPDKQQFASRIFLGNQFSRYAAIEIGGEFVSKIQFNLPSNVKTAQCGAITDVYANNVLANIPSPCTETSLRIRGIDAVIKGIMPLGESFDVYGKFGVAVIYETSSGGLNPTSTGQTITVRPGPQTLQQNGQTIQTYQNGQIVQVMQTTNTYTNKVAPTFSIGASYAINQNWVVDLSYNSIQVGSSYGNVKYAALGFSYHATSRYCGQFLCDD